MSATKEQYADLYQIDMSPAEIAKLTLKRLESILNSKEIALIEKNMDGMNIQGLYLSLPIRKISEFENEVLESLGF